MKSFFPCKNSNTQTKNRDVYSLYPQDDHSEAWAIYYDIDNNFSFYFPSEWFIQRGNPMVISGHQSLGGGGFVGIEIVLIYENQNKDTLEKLINSGYFKNKIGSSGNFEEKNGVNFKEALINRHVPGAGDGQAVYIRDKSDRVIVFYCGSCDNQVTNKIYSTFKSPIQQ